MFLFGCFRRFHFFYLFAAALLVSCVSSQGDKYLLSTDGGAQSWGHPVVKRNQTGLATTATRPRSWVDYDVSLPTGRLVGFRAYVNRIDVTTALSPPGQQGTGLWFQIWYAISRTQYRLLYQKRTETNNTEGVIQVDVDGEFYLPSYCRMGWTSETAIIPISFDFVDAYPVYYRAINNQATDFPAPSQLYSDFSNNPYPVVFSASVVIDPRLIGATGATGPSSNGSNGGNGSYASVGATGPVGPPGPPGPPGSPGRGSSSQTFTDIDYSRCMNVSSVSATANNNCSQVLCNNSDGSRTCACVGGYVLSSDARTCQDFDECSVHNGGCAYSCINTIGSYYCNCTQGLTLANNSEDCLDVDECLTVRCRQVCVNTFGSYRCIAIENRIQAAQGQDIASSYDQQQNSAAALNGAMTTGILVWIGVLTLAVLTLTLAFLLRWRRQGGSRGGGGAPFDETSPSEAAKTTDSSSSSSSSSFDGRSNIGFEDSFADWKLSIADRQRSKPSSSSSSSSRLGPSLSSIVMSLNGDGDGAETTHNSKL